MLEKMSEMIAEQLNCDAAGITAETSFKDDLGADSLDLFELVMALETDKKVYDVEDIQRLLGIGRSKAYTYLDEVYRKQEPFRVIKIGKLFRVPKQSFDNWLDRIT